MLAGSSAQIHAKIKMYFVNGTMISENVFDVGRVFKYQNFSVFLQHIILLVIT